jgi:uncharacterized membrane protein
MSSTGGEQRSSLDPGMHGSAAAGVQGLALDKSSKSLRVGLLLLTLIGIVLSGVSLHNHYQEETTDYCTVDEAINCDLVNRSVYSEFLGLPVALIGVVGYGFLLLLSLPRRPRMLLRTARLLAATMGLAFSLYLTYVEAYVLAVWCMLCVASLIAILAITGLAGIGARAGGRTALGPVKPAAPA